MESMRRRLAALVVIAAIGLAVWLWRLPGRPERAFPGGPRAARDGPTQQPSPERHAPIARQASPPPAVANPPPPAEPAFYGFCPDPARKATAYLSRPSLRDSHARALAAQDEALLTELVAFGEADTAGDETLATEHLRAARARAPDDPAVALALGVRLVNTPDLAGARSALSTYLRQHPKDIAISQLHARLGTREEIEATFSHRTRGGLTLAWPPDAGFEIETLLDDIDAALDDASRLLDVTKRRTLNVVVYPSRSELLAATCVPPWSVGLYDGTLRLVAELMTQPESRRRLVRHEVLHAAVGAVVPRAPVWFQEGLAQYFAGEESAAHARTFRAMVKNRTYIPFSSLEGSFMVFREDEDASLAYHESLGVIELIIDRQGINAIADVMRLWRGRGDPERVVTLLGGRLPLSENDLLDFLARRSDGPDR
jgi:hypothetical protein